MRTPLENILAAVFGALLVAVLAVTPAAIKEARAGEVATAFETCVVSVDTTSTSVSALIKAQTNCSAAAVGGYVKIKVVGATSVCVGGKSGTTGDPGTLAAGNQCYALTTGQEFPSVVPTNAMTLRVQSGTSLVSVAAAIGG